MIDYSVYKQPNPMDETAAPKAYAKAQMRELMDFNKFIAHIASHNGGFSRGVVQGVISDTCLCVVEQLLEGKKVDFAQAKAVIRTILLRAKSTFYFEQ
jgi:hypothetical protein